MERDRDATPQPVARTDATGPVATAAFNEVIQQAVAAYRRGEWDEADRLCRAALEAKADDFDALHLSGIIAASSGRVHDAAALLARAVAAQPSSAAAHSNLGNVLRMQGHFAEALESHERALALNPDSADAHNNCGNALCDLRRHAEALTRYDRALAIAPNHAEAHNNRGGALVALGRRGEALGSFARALEIKPGNAETHNNRGNILFDLGRRVEALESYDRAIALRPDYADAHYNRANALRSLDRPEDSLPSYERALLLRPGFARAFNNRGSALVDLQRHAEAVQSYEQAIALKPDYANAFFNRGNALRDLHRHAEAVESYQQALVLKPDFADAHWNLANCRLSMGEFALGWADFEWRWKTERKARERRPFQQPLWLGGESLADKTILLHFEHGLGDTLQFCRFVKSVAARGATVILEVQPPLLPLLGNLEGATTVLPSGAALPAFDCQCPLMSLPAAFNTDLSNIPADIPYVHSDPARVAAWGKKLGERTRKRIGLVWSGSNSLRHDPRSIALDSVLPLVSEDAEWVSLQKEVRPAEAALLAANPRLRHFGDELNDFGDTAALAQLMDVVVTVDTSVAHLAGAMGKPVWILLPFNSALWTWMLEREDSVWYPTARLFRQPRIGDWASVLRRVEAAIKEIGESP